MKIAFKDNKILTLGGKTFSLVAGPLTIYTVTCEDDGHGSIIATPASGRKDTLITLSNTPNAQYRLNKYTLDGNDLQGNTFAIQNDCIAKGWFERYIFNISLSQPQHGTVSSNKNTAEAGETVTLSNTPDTDYQFDHYTVNGSSIAGSTFSMPAQDTVVSGVFSVIPSYNVNVSQVTGGTITANKQTAKAGETVTLSSTPDPNYDFDYYTVNGVAIVGNTFTMPASDVTVSGSFTINYNPLNLPAGTVRVRTSDGNPPVKDSYTSYESATLVSGTSDTYDVYKSGQYFTYLLKGSTNVVEVLGANLSNVTEMRYMFGDCSNLASVALFDTSSATNMERMFTNCSALTTIPKFDTSKVTNMFGMFISCSELTTVPLLNTSRVTNMASMMINCYKLTSIPLFDTSSVTNIRNAFRDCTKVQTGALALYQQASSQATPPSDHLSTFMNCGSNTTTGAAELAQIPSDWK